MQKITEQPSLYDHLEKMTVEEILVYMNREDQKVPLVVQQLIPAVSRLVEDIVDRMLGGGRLFYIGAGTSGRLGIVDASECPPTFGVPHGLVIGLIAGGDQAIRRAVEHAEDDPEQGWKDLEAHHIQSNDTVVGIAASGTTPYVVGALQRCRQHQILTACITCNPDAPVTQYADHPLVAVVGPEFVTGSTRLKAGTAQKLLLNMISTAVMIKLGRVKGNKMVDMQLSNDKLIDRGTRMVQEALGLDYNSARERLLRFGSVRKAIEQ
ncbi:MAG: N-acetylmuramic acid 6-phosphate etherase [Chitinophagales bacterium]|nr:MAG: N-acetylmuramic acid 6-phosphate etherase [Chitinophagales bacterium]